MNSLHYIIGRSKTLEVSRILLSIVIVAFLGLAPFQFIDTYADIDTAKAGIDDLKNKVQNFVDSDVLNDKQGNKLTKKLDNAKKHLDGERVTPAINQIQSFIKKVTSFIKAGIFTEVEGQSLIDDPIPTEVDAFEIIEELGGTPIELVGNEDVLLGDTGEISVDVGEELIAVLIKNVLPDIQLDIIEFSPATDLVDFTLEIIVNSTISNEPNNVDIISGFEVNPSVDLSTVEDFVDPPVATFEFFKGDVSPDDLVVVVFDESLDEWVLLDPPIVIDETDESFILQVALLHFSTFAIGSAVPDGGGGPAYVIMDTKPPEIMNFIVTPTNYFCVETADDVGTKKLSYNGKEIPKRVGSFAHFCTNEEIPLVIKVVVEDGAGNKSERIVINGQQIVTKRTEQRFSALVSEDLNPHHSVEGIDLEAAEPLKQIRLAKSPAIDDRAFYISEKGMEEFVGKQTIEVVYKGQYSNTLFGSERYGEIYVFAINGGKIATFDVVVKDDIRLYPHKESEIHAPYDLNLLDTTLPDEMNLNTWQKAELERIFTSDEKLTIVQYNVASMFLKLANDL